MAPAAFAESPSGYRTLIPPEQLNVVAMIAFGSDDEVDTGAGPAEGTL